jgi:hypothetical protein
VCSAESEDADDAMIDPYLLLYIKFSAPYCINVGAIVQSGRRRFFDHIPIMVSSLV